jgi:hypothetical protein
MNITIVNDQQIIDLCLEATGSLLDFKNDVKNMLITTTIILVILFIIYITLYVKRVKKC